jgi:hypothetical protein
MSDVKTDAPPEITRNVRRPPIHSGEERDAVHEPVHTRRRRKSNTISEDRFAFPLDQIPEGSSYEWKRFSVMGQEDPFYIAAMREQGWEPVDPKRHINLLPPGYTLPHIIRDGLILMERPSELTREARSEMEFNAKKQMREAEQRIGKTPDGTLTRDHPDVRPRITKEYMRPVAIEE